MLTLQKQIPENVIEILTLVTNVADKMKIPSFIVGATARDLILEYVYRAGIKRATKDIDFGVAVVNWEQYERLKNALTATGKFKSDDKIEQRLWWTGSGGNMKIDLVPYGGVESPIGTVTFPPTGFEMNTSGFAEAYEDALTLQISEELPIRIVSLAGLAVLKFIAYDDRPQQRQTDLSDILFLMKTYLEAGNEERLYADDNLLNDENFDLRSVGARMLGRDMAKLLTAQTRKTILKHLSESDAENSRLNKIAEMINYREKGFEENFADIVRMLQQLKLGITENS